MVIKFKNSIVSLIMMLSLLLGLVSNAVAVQCYTYPEISAGTLNLEWYSQLDFNVETLRVSSDDKIYIFGGHTTANYSIRKYTPSGTEEWCRPINWVYQFSINSIEVANIYFDTLNNIFICGRVSEVYWMTNHWTSRIGPLFIIKCNSEGYLQWYRFWRLDDDEGILDVSFTFDSSNNIYVAGAAYLDNPTVEFNTDLFLLKYSSSGTLLWNKIWGTYTYEYVFDFYIGLTIDSSNNAYVLWTADDEEDLFLSKFDQSGVSIWNETIPNLFSSFTSNMKFNFNIYIDNMGNLIIVGHTYELGEGKYDIIIIKYNPNGGIIWYETWGGTQNDYWRSLLIDSLNNLFITGTTESFGIDEEIFLLKFDQSGNLMWNKTWGGTGDDSCFGMWFDTSNIINLKGETNNELLILQYDKLGAYQNHFTWDPEELEIEGYRYPGIPDSSNNLICYSFTRKFTLEGEYILFKLSLESSNGNDGDNNGTTAIPGYQIPLIISIFMTLIILIVIKKRKVN